MTNFIITGAAGFIGFHLTKKLLSEGHKVVGIDNLNDYYDVKLKLDRLAQLIGNNFNFENIDIADKGKVLSIFDRYPETTHVINLAAQAGVLYSLKHPSKFVDSNVHGILNILEGCKEIGVRHCLFASSASVYGANKQLPWAEHHGVDHQISLYGATKKASESIAHSYAYMYDMNITGLRFFNVYGPWGRPDSAGFIFTKAILAGEPITVYGHGDMYRDFTYVGDIVKGVAALAETLPTPDENWDDGKPCSSFANYRVYNIGNSKPVHLMHFIKCLEKELDKKAIMNFEDIRHGEIVFSKSDTTRLAQAVGYRPTTLIEDGVKQFIDWWKVYYGV